MEKKEPLFRISKRGAIPWWASLGIRLIGLLIALILCALISFLPDIKRVPSPVRRLAAPVLAVLCLAALASQGYAPFVYFQF